MSMVFVESFMKKPKRLPAPNYFLVGATWDGESMYDSFIQKGVWKSSWGSEDDQYRPIMEQAKKGDRIAIKKGLGQGSAEIQIRAIGIIKAIDLDEEYCTFYVEWVRVGMKRIVDSKGAYKTIHGPYSRTCEQYGSWINQVFCL
jgi:hypothetical protein